MNMTDIAENYKKGLISSVNAIITRATVAMTSNGVKALVEFNYFEDMGQDCKPEFERREEKILIDIDKLDKFVKLFLIDGSPAEFPTIKLITKLWELDDIKGKYVRLFYYRTPEKEMHELSDPTELVAIKHVYDETYTFYV